MISASAGRILLIIASILGIVQSIMMLAGCIMASKDKHEDLDDTGLLLSNSSIDTKYRCGGIRLASIPKDIANNDCHEDYILMDRGWFRRAYDLCKDTDNKDICDLNGYAYVLALGITSGIGWIISAGVAFVAGITTKKLLGLIAGGCFIVFYFIFVVLFTLIWDSVQEINIECLNNVCKDVKRRGKKSAHEVLAYSVFGFVFIFAAIICSFLGALGLDEFTYVPTISPSCANAAESGFKLYNNKVHPEDQATIKE